jgi:hypothetical protein
VELPRRGDLDVAVEAALHLEFAGIDLTLVAGDDHVVAVGKREGRESADGLADDVAPGGENAEGRSGESLAAGRATSFRVTVAARWLRVAAVTRPASTRRSARMMAFESP